jgi:hypothetical protein
MSENSDDDFVKQHLRVQAEMRPDVPFGRSHPTLTGKIEFDSSL